jgi:mRNA interferase RelE/StbE
MRPQLETKVEGALQTILFELHSGKPLKDELSGLRSFRVGRLSIVYRLSGKRTIEIVPISPCKRIYEEACRIIEKREKAVGFEILTSF